MEPSKEDLVYIGAHLQSGDFLLYDSNGIFGRLIKFKRGERFTHVEIYVGDGKAVASRDGIGVGLYDLRLNGLAGVYRPDAKPNITEGMKWFQAVNGQPYDWVGLLSFAWAQLRGRENGAMFCSEFAVRFYRACQCELFSLGTDADAVSPEMLSYSPKIGEVWLRADKKKVH